jgi:hypothetical protein
MEDKDLKIKKGLIMTVGLVVFLMIAYAYDKSRKQLIVKNLQLNSVKVIDVYLSKRPVYSQIVYAAKDGDAITKTYQTNLKMRRLKEVIGKTILLAYDSVHPTNNRLLITKEDYDLVGLNCDSMGYFYLE